MQYIIGSWYRKDELAKRSCIFHTSGGIGSMFSGYLMASVFHLGGRGGFKGWQWYGIVKHLVFYVLIIFLKRLFIVDGIISLPVALAGFFVLPDVPEISNPWYLTEKVCISRRNRPTILLTIYNRKCPWLKSVWSLKVVKSASLIQKPSSRRSFHHGTYTFLHSYMCT